MNQKIKVEDAIKWLAKNGVNGQKVKVAIACDFERTREHLYNYCYKLGFNSPNKYWFKGGHLTLMLMGMREENLMGARFDIIISQRGDQLTSRFLHAVDHATQNSICLNGFKIPPIAILQDDGGIWTDSSCKGCKYKNNNRYVFCAVHPIEQPNDCIDYTT